MIWKNVDLDKVMHDKIDCHQSNINKLQKINSDTHIVRLQSREVDKNIPFLIFLDNNKQKYMFLTVAVKVESN